MDRLSHLELSELSEKSYRFSMEENRFAFLENRIIVACDGMILAGRVP
jgi:hypothetical protein